jgi:hypothetical protein
MRWVALTVIMASACGRVGFAPRGGTGDGGGGAEAGVPDGGDATVCETPVEMQHPDEGAMHQDGGVIDWTSNPPTSGTHYPEWAHWNRVYAEVIPRGYWVHNLEHGGIVFTYNCPTGCPDDVARLTALLASLPAEVDCPALVHRALVTPDPDLPAGVRFAASGWLYSWTSNCVDEAALTSFYTRHFAMGPEVNCGDGSYP